MIVGRLRIPHSAFRTSRRLRRVPRERAQRLAAHGQGVCPRRDRFCGVLRALLRRQLELGGGRPARGARLARRHAAARPRQALGGARPLGGAHVLPVPRRHARPRGQSGQGRPHPEARAHSPHAPGPLRDRPAVRGGGAPGRRRRVHRDARPRHARAVLLDRHAPRGAGGVERPGSRPRVGPGESARQGQGGAHRPGGDARGSGVAALFSPARRRGRGGRGNGRPARGVPGPQGQAADAAQRAARGEAAVARTAAWARPARALPTAFVRHPPARRGRGPAGGTGAVGPRLARHHAGVYSYVGGTAEKGIPSSTSEGMTRIRSTTILAVRREGHVALGGDGQVTLGDTVMKANANKVRTLKGGKILAGFAGASADAFTLFEKFEEKLERYPGNVPRAAVELAKDWRSDRVLRRLEALLVVADKSHGFVISGNGELIEPDDGILAIGSGGSYALAAARALAANTQLSAAEIVRQSLTIAGEICVYTNTNITVLEAS